jgi:hypothetical protein
MRKAHLVLLLVASQVLVACSSLSVVTVNAPAVNTVFDPSGTIPVQDHTAPIWTDGFLQSRSFQGVAGAPAAGLFGYEYRIDLRQVAGILSIPFITSLAVDFGPHVNTLDYNGDGRADDVYVVTTGGLGNIGVSSATKSGNVITFNFNPPVAGGASPGRGDSTFFFGLASTHPRREITATANNNQGAPLTLSAWAPNHP